jgi:hypothetical protein
VNFGQSGTTIQSKQQEMKPQIYHLNHTLRNTPARQRIDSFLPLQPPLDNGSDKVIKSISQWNNPRNFFPTAAINMQVTSTYYVQI